MPNEDYWRLQVEAARAQVCIAIRALQTIAAIYDGNTAWTDAQAEEMADTAKEALKKIQGGDALHGG